MPAKPPRGGPAWKQDDDGRKLPLVPIIVGVVALLAVIAIVASSVANEDSSDEDLQQTAPVSTSGDTLPKLEGEQDAAIGAPAPALTGQSFDGSTVEIADDGRPKVVIFVAHWCPHCQVEIPKIVDWFGDNGVPDDVDVYAVATGTGEDRPNYPPSRWLEREEWEQPTLVDDEAGSAASAFGLSAYPFYVALDADNAVVARGSGELSTAAWESLLDLARG